MAIKKTTSKPPKASGTSAGKSNPKAALKGKGSLPKVTKSRGSKTMKQVGNDNQREWFNGQRDVKQKRDKNGRIIGSTVPGFKVSKADAKSQGFDVADMRKSQRSGGRGK